MLHSLGMDPECQRMEDTFRIIERNREAHQFSFQDQMFRKVATMLAQQFGTIDSIMAKVKEFIQGQASP